MGITRNAIIELARADGIAVHEIAATRHDLYTADECFLTGTAAEVIPVVKCDAEPSAPAPGPITRKLLERFRQLTRIGEPVPRSAWEHSVDALRRSKWTRAARSDADVKDTVVPRRAWERG